MQDGLSTLAGWRRALDHLDTAAAHGISALNAIRDAIEGNAWLSHSPDTRSWDP